MTDPVGGPAAGGEAEKPIAVFLLDDHEVVRRGVRDLLEAEPDITVVGEAGTASSALARIPALRPDVAVLDVRLPDGDGVTVCREIRSRMPEVACLMLTSFGDDEALFDAIMAGAAGYVLKQIRGTDLVGAVRTVASGQSMLDPRAAGQLMARLRDQRASATRWPACHAAGAQDPRADRRGPDQPADRRADVPGREDGEELRVRPVRQARHGTPHPGRRLRGPASSATSTTTRLRSRRIRDLVPSVPGPARGHPDGMYFDGSALEQLPRDECLRLMASAPVGRIIYTRQALPAVELVNFALDHGDIVIRTDHSGKLAAATAGAVVAFEADSVDPACRVGWSVTAIGQAQGSPTRPRSPAGAAGLELMGPRAARALHPDLPGILNGRGLTAQRDGGRDQRLRRW